VSAFVRGQLLFSLCLGACLRSDHVFRGRPLSAFPPLWLIDHSFKQQRLRPLFFERFPVSAVSYLRTTSIHLTIGLCGIILSQKVFCPTPPARNSRDLTTLQPFPPREDVDPPSILRNGNAHISQRPLRSLLAYHFGSGCVRLSVFSLARPFSAFLRSTGLPSWSDRSRLGWPFLKPLSSHGLLDFFFCFASLTPEYTSVLGCSPLSS